MANPLVCQRYYAPSLKKAYKHQKFHRARQTLNPCRTLAVTILVTLIVALTVTLLATPPLGVESRLEPYSTLCSNLSISLLTLHRKKMPRLVRPSVSAETLTPKPLSLKS